jgi:hypothetical protein
VADPQDFAAITVLSSAARKEQLKQDADAAAAEVETSRRRLLLW